MTDILQISYFYRDHAEITDKKKYAKHKDKKESDKVYTVSLLFKE